MKTWGLMFFDRRIRRKMKMKTTTKKFKIADILSKELKNYDER